jgi:subtilisin family serine protease
LFIAAAGNNAGNHAIANQITYPCGYAFANIVCVAATTQNDTIASFSNRGPGVHVAAP